MDQQGRSPFAVVSQEFMTAVIRAEKAAILKNHGDFSLRMIEAMRAQSAILAVFAQTLDLTVKELKVRGDTIDDLMQRVEDLEGQMGNMARGLEKLNEEGQGIDFIEVNPLASRYVNTREKE